MNLKRLTFGRYFMKDKLSIGTAFSNLRIALESFLTDFYFFT